MSAKNRLANILVVDDVPDNLRLLTNLLSNRGYKVRPTTSGAHALSTSRKEVPDLILLDVLMPDMDGYEVCREFKGQESTKNIPVIFLSALNELEDKIKGFEAGGVDYITKPFYEREVMQRVETHLQIRFLQKSLMDETARFKTLANAAFESILIHNGREIIDVNTAAIKLFQCGETDLIGTDPSVFIKSDAHLKSTIDSLLPAEIMLKNFKGESIPVKIQTKSLEIENGEVNVTAIHDLTFQKEIEREKEYLLQENTALKAAMQDRYKFGDIIGKSSVMQTVYTLITKASATDYPVVIYGESGTGKELAAKTIHELYQERAKPFVTVNCGAITESLFEREFFGHRKGAFTDAIQDKPGYLDAADNGTLFLDEIGELPLAMQVKLLRVLENGEFIPVGDVTAKKVNTRFIAATNKNLYDLVINKKFREDLFFRLQVIEITMPPLRERREDIRLLVENILSEQNAEHEITSLPEELRNMLFHYDWPGNVRELMNTIQRFLATDLITLPGREKLPDHLLKPDTGLHNAVEELELKLISQALDKTGWHRGETADLLKIPRRTLQRKMTKYKFNQSAKKKV